MYRSFQDIPGMDEHKAAMAEMVKAPADPENVQRIEDFCAYVIRYLTMTGLSEVREQLSGAACLGASGEHQRQ